MANLVKLQKFTAIAFFVASGLGLALVVFDLLRQGGSLDLGNVGKALLFGAAGAYFWRRSKKDPE